jgi:hypothetical protein
MSREVTVIFAEWPPGSDRGCPREVTVDNLSYPKYLAKSPLGNDRGCPCYVTVEGRPVSSQVIVVAPGRSAPNCALIAGH